jgi:DNA-binding PadR family transcriptional regulator
MLTDAEMAVLSLVTETPRHGYAIEQAIEERGMRSWTDIGFSSIYYLLGKLERKGLVASRPGPSREGPARKEFAATARGRRALRAAVTEALAAPARSGRALMLALSCSPMLTRSELTAAVEQRRDALHALAAEVEAAGRRGAPAHVDEMFEYSRRLLEAELAWTDGFLARAGERGATVTKIDLKTELRDLYAGKPGACRLVDVPDLGFLMIDGEGDPNTSPEYAAALQTLYAAAYALKFSAKAAGLDFVVTPAEGLWWTTEETSAPGVPGARWLWRWTMMLALPDEIDADRVGATIATLDPARAPALDRLRYERFHEGRAMQVLHVGPYSAEAPTIAALHAAIAEQGYRAVGRHHEIYLGDPRRSAPEKLKTILRQPVEAA